MINSLWDLPTERYEGSIVAKLPTPTYILPREKPVPVPKPPTKWELYAKEKGIKNVKKTQSVWDDILKVRISELNLSRVSFGVMLVKFSEMGAQTWVQKSNGRKGEKLDY